MTWDNASPSPATDRGIRIALIFALAAERLSVYYEHDQWLKEGQGASLAADWLARSKRRLPLDERRQLSALSEQLARQIADTLSREAALHTAHEMMEALDPNYESEIGRALMVECERLLDGAVAEQAAAKGELRLAPDP
ncbi:hypothetical protein [Accumulibacter sp.]|uniref:hypothetical protein n=1 Tax=Accumulibacter sp. TaxID=2053492 RepID=UPI0035B211A8